MFSTFKQKLLLGIYIFIVLSIPIGAYLVQQATQIRSLASSPKNPPTVTRPPVASDSASELLALSAVNSKASPTAEPTTTMPTSYGPTLALKAILEGRPANNQKTSLFIGIVSGSFISPNPKFLLSFTVDLPQSGQYQNISLAGLTPGNTYTALLKGATQIATSSAFVMSPSVSNLNSGNPLTMLTGDLNQDNQITQADVDIVKAAWGATPTSSNWNSSADLNEDGVVNSLDLLLVSKNLGKIGDSGVWSSNLPKNATPSGSLASEATNLPVGSTLENNSSGYWVWVPK